MVDPIAHHHSKSSAPISEWLINLVQVERFWEGTEVGAISVLKTLEFPHVEVRVQETSETFLSKPEKALWVKRLRSVVPYAALISMSILMLGVFVPYGVRCVVPRFPLKWEKKLFYRLSNRIRNAMSPCSLESKSPGRLALQKMVNRIIDVDSSQLPRTLEVEVVRGHQVNAFVFPGGFVAVESL